MSTDNLNVILGMIRAELPDDQKATLDQIKRLIGVHAGGVRVYVPTAPRKRSHLEKLAELGADADAQQIAKMLGVSVRHARRLKQMRGG